MYHQGEGDGWRAASPVRVVRNLSPPRHLGQATTPGSSGSGAWYSRSNEIARLSGKAEMLRTQISTIREGPLRRLTPGTRIRAISELTVRGIQAVAIGDLGMVHGPSDDPSLQEGVNIRWDCRRDGGTRRINVLITDIEPLQDYPTPSPPYITRSPYAPSLPRPAPLSMYTSPVPVHTQTTPSISAPYPPPPLPDPITSAPTPSPAPVPTPAPTLTPSRASPPPAPVIPDEKLFEEEGRLRAVQQRFEEEQKKLAVVEAERRREEEKAKHAETVIKTEETRLAEITKRIQEEESRLEALLQRQEAEKQEAEAVRLETSRQEEEARILQLETSRQEEEARIRQLEVQRQEEVINEVARLQVARIEEEVLEESTRGSPVSPAVTEAAEDVIVNDLSIRMEDSVQIDATLDQTAILSSPEKPDSSPIISRQASGRERHIHFDSAQGVPHLGRTIDEVESLMLATPTQPPIHGKLGLLQGEWRDNGECKWVVDELSAKITRPSGTSSVYQITCTPTGGLVLDGAQMVDILEKEIRWEDGDTWTRVQEFNPVAHRCTSSVSSANTTPAVWMSMSRKNSMRSLGGTQRSLLSRKGSLGVALSKLAESTFVDELEEAESEGDVDDVVWWQVPKVDVANVTFLHPHHGDPPGATTSPNINTVITFDTHGEPPALRCAYDGVQQSNISSITLERTEHGVFLLFPDEGDGPIPDRVVALPPDNMNTVVAGIVCLAERANVKQHLVYEYEALANQEAIVERYLRSSGSVPWSFVNSLLPPDYLKQPAADASVLAVLCIIASGMHHGGSGMCLVM